MVNPEGTMLAGIVEADTTVPFRTQEDPVAGGRGRSYKDKLTIAGIVEVDDEHKPMRPRLEPIQDYSPQDVLKRYLDEFVFRWNRRRQTATAFDALLEFAVRLPHARLHRPARLTRASAAPGVTFNTPATASGITREAALGATPACQAANPA